MTTSPLQKLHEDAGAEIGERDGVPVALGFGDPKAEHRAVRRTAGLLDLHPIGVGRLVGDDRRSYLHDVLTARVEGRETGEVFPSAFMTAEGQIQAHFHVAMLEDASLFVIDGSLDPIVDGMRTYTMISNVEIESTDLGGIAVAGPEAADRLEAAGLPWPGPGHAVETEAETVLGVDRTGSGGAWILAGPDRLGTLWSEIEGAGATPVGRRVGEALRIEAKIPRWQAEVQGDRLPQEVGIRDAVDFEKGCFPGQEAVAKLENLGQPRTHLEVLVLEGDVPAAGAPVTADDRLVGEVTSAERSPGVGGVVALALLKRGEGAPGTEVVCGDATGRVVDGPVYEDAGA